MAESATFHLVHCYKCIDSTCQLTESCPVISCPDECGACLHQCKLVDHQEVCSHRVVPCTNAVYGCVSEVKRYELLNHIKRCPASTIVCKCSWTRGISFPKRQPLQMTDYGEAAAPLYDSHLYEADLACIRAEYPAAGDKDYSQEISPGVLSSCCKYGPQSLPQGVWPKQGRVKVETSDVSYASYHFPHQRASHKCYTFWCCAVVRRDESEDHYKWHSMITSLDGSWLVQLCPLRAYGCLCAIERFLPTLATHREATVKFDVNSHTFTVGAISMPGVPMEDAVVGPYAEKIKKKKELEAYGYYADESLDPISQLPHEILAMILERLDSLSLFHLSRVNHKLRNICCRNVKLQGVVEVEWTKLERPDMPWKWREGKKRVRQVNKMYLDNYVYNPQYKYISTVKTLIMDI